MKNVSDVKKYVVRSIVESVKSNFNIDFAADLRLEYPPNIELGDFAVSGFELSKILKKSPPEIAQKIATAITADDIIEKAQATGPYINIKIKNNILFGAVCSEAINKNDSFGSPETKEGEKVMVEYLSPNTNKPLHLGHLRNGSLGMAISRLFVFFGNDVIKANLVNDRGVHICKSMLAWLRWGNGETPESTGEKGDHFVGRWYVRYAIEEEKDPNLANEVQAMLKKWEDGDPETIALWEKMNGWVYDGFAKTYEDFGLEFDEFLYESNTYKSGKDVVAKGLEKGVFRKDEKGAIIYDLPIEKFGADENGASKKVTVLRSDGTSVYITQDISTALLKAERYHLDRSIYVVGSEQGHHFKCLFEILNALGYEWAKKCHHLSYAMVYLPEGKMKSREGKVVDADNLIEEVKNIVAEEIRQKSKDGNLSEEEIAKRAHIIAIGAIKFYLLRVNPGQDIHFDPKESVSLDGFTGPYCQYAYVRAGSILRRAQKDSLSLDEIDFSVLGENEELTLIQKLAQFPEEMAKAKREYNPSRIAGSVFEIAKAFNQFYHKHKVIGADNQELEKARITLVKSSAIAIKNGLNLLGIIAIDEM